MGILDDIARLGLSLNDEDNRQINAIIEDAHNQKHDEFLRKPVIEYLVSEYITAARPDIWAVLKRDREQENMKDAIRLNRKFDDKGDRICDETGCGLTDGVKKCDLCERFICSKHTYSESGWCCYACWIEHFKGREA